jgi:hypothetical protein
VSRRRYRRSYPEAGLYWFFYGILWLVFVAPVKAGVALYRYYQRKYRD